MRVKPAQIISFGYSPHTVSTDSGVEPELPPTGSAVWSNGDTTNEPIIWEANDRYMDREGGTYTVTGTVDGWASSVKVTVTVNPASVRDTTTPEVTTTVGTEPVLPDTVKVTWTNGDTTDEPVTWDLPPAETWDDSDLVGETLSVTGKLTNYGQDVAANVTVEAAPAEEPGTEEPGTEQPGTEEPGTEEPGTEKPDNEQPLSLIHISEPTRLL